MLNYLGGKFQTLDGRWLILTVLLGYFSFLLSAELLFGAYERAWKYLGVYSVRSFTDLEVLLCGIEEYLQNRDPYSWVKCTYNYPLLWVLFSYIPYFSLPYLIQIGIVLIVLFFGGVLLFIKKINLRDALIYSVLLLSPSVMLAVERGNCDVILFLLVLLSTYFLAQHRKGMAYFFILFSAFLKLYPVAGFIYLLESTKTKKTLFVAGFVTILLFVLYLLAIQEQLKPIYKIHPRSYFLSYGIYTLPALLHAQVSSFSLEMLKTASFIVAVLGCIYLIIAQVFSAEILNKDLHRAEPLFFNGYLIGSTIFVSTFIAGNNFDYRLIFLILTLPQLLYWSRLPHLRKTSLIQLGILGVVLWNPFISGVSKYFLTNKFIIHLIDDILNWTLFFIHVKFLSLYVFQRLKQLQQENISAALLSENTK